MKIGHRPLLPSLSDVPGEPAPSPSISNPFYFNNLRTFCANWSPKISRNSFPNNRFRTLHNGMGDVPSHGSRETSPPQPRRMSTGSPLLSRHRERVANCRSPLPLFYFQALAHSGILDFSNISSLFCGFRTLCEKHGGVGVLKMTGSSTFTLAPGLPSTCCLSCFPGLFLCLV